MSNLWDSQQKTPSSSEPGESSDTKPAGRAHAECVSPFPPKVECVPEQAGFLTYRSSPTLRPSRHVPVVLMNAERLPDYSGGTVPDSHRLPYYLPIMDRKHLIGCHMQLQT